MTTSDDAEADPTRVSAQQHRIMTVIRERIQERGYPPRRLRPGTEINTAAVAAMNERGIDIAAEYPKPWTDEVVHAADVMVTMGCGDADRSSLASYLNWVLDDPAGQAVEDVRPIRDEIERRVRALLTNSTSPRSSDGRRHPDQHGPRWRGDHHRSRVRLRIRPAGCGKG
jgi:hypothetical protein